METLKICPRCGLQIEGRTYRPASGPYELLCERCWGNRVIKALNESDKLCSLIVAT